MKSGLEDRNNLHFLPGFRENLQVSMKSGLEDRNNRVINGIENHILQSQ
ncbi:hypothetical protein HMPREF9154_2750 [Arachnia propionica F0230a]|nr:hypothetical protein HMPREF9154_2750 [Arachnia propionica F0230a]